MKSVEMLKRQTEKLKLIKNSEKKTKYQLLH